MKTETSIFWLRRDLRLDDNAGLYKALKNEKKVLPIFIFDSNILTSLPSQDARLIFIHRELAAMKIQLESMGTSMLTFHGTPREAYMELQENFKINRVYINRDYEPYAQQRDIDISQWLKEQDIELIGSKDHVIFEKSEVMKDDGSPYTVFTPYSKKWKAKLNAFYMRPYPALKYSENFLQCDPFPMTTLKQLGFEDFDFPYFPKKEIDKNLVGKYDKTRDYPGVRGYYTLKPSFEIWHGEYSRTSQNCRVSKRKIFE